MRIQSIVMSVIILLFSVPSLRGEVVDFEGFPAHTWPATDSCAPMRTIQAGITAISGGYLMQGFPGFRYTNTSTFYITSHHCPGATPTFTIVFSVPVSNVSLDLIPGVYEDDYISITDDTGNHQTELIPGSTALARPMKNVTLACSGCTEITLTTLSLFYSFGIDNIQFDPAPVALQFDLGANTPEGQRRVLISKARGDDQFPSNFQERDGRIKIRIRSSIAQAGINIYLRVVDPPDPSPYIPQANQVTNDNRGVAGQLSNTLAVTDSGGIAETELTVSAVAGDNYQIEASIDPAIRNPATPCGAGCEKSGVLTAWKRVYVEAHKAFRRGSFLTGNIAPGDTVIPVEEVNVFPDPPFRVRLIHAPPVYDGSRTDFYEEEVEVRDVVSLPSPGRSGELHLRHPSAPTVGDTISKLYTGPEAAGASAVPRPYLADAVGVVDGTSSSFEAAVDTSLVTSLFETMFVEVKWLKDDNLREWTDPVYRRIIPRVALVNRFHREWLSRKWIRNASTFGEHRIAAPNHQFLFLSDRSSSRGDTTVAEGFNDLWLYAGMFANAAMRREGLVHEMGHEWLVNHQWLIPNPPNRRPGGHCDVATGAERFIYNRPNLRCVMHSTLYGDFSNPGVADGIVGFHFITINGQNDSEYLRIRERADPVPQNENVGRRPN